MALGGAAADAPRADFVGRYVWKGSGPEFGGFSAIDFTDNGMTFVAVSDSANIFWGRLERGKAGAVTGVEVDPPIRPLSHHGTPVENPMDDAEGVAIGTGGLLYVSYETWNRIGIYEQNGRVWVHEIWPKPFFDFVVNGGAEALAIDAEGALYAMPERPIHQGDQIPVYRMKGDNWDVPFTLRRDGDWAPVGADFGPDGRLYLLERDYWGLIGFMTRVRRITLDGDRVVADEVLFETRAGQHDNLEGLAVWRDAEGAVRLTMISDDNFLPTQRTEIVDYRIRD
ncbi:hypothetical protein DEA8626_03132 [Defluviimonas aquaemixtae]|uniref:Phytase-like domain-containing protein n=1 Tax=Albidovulum aquaemixtae TaxID=1542388 RepID=A0A2R8BL64_9RHOB|nr:hypothetical protein DEA8626_03132 [Defluviimonas aquaemixtae]